MNWQRTSNIIIGSAVGALALAWGAILIVDPYRVNPWAPDMPRPTMDDSQRLAYPTIARDPTFTGAVFGTSTSRFFDPEVFENNLGGKFASLTLVNFSNPDDQLRLIRLFLQSGKREHIVLGVDDVWCRRGENANPPSGRDEFPEWLYDDKRWNDFTHGVNLRTLAVSARLAAHWLLFDRLGRPRSTYGFNGYSQFLPAARSHDLAAVRRAIYGAATPIPRPAPREPVVIGASDRQGWRFADHGSLEQFVAGLPGETFLTIFFVPYHLFHQPVEGTVEAAVMAECKRRIASIATRHKNSQVLDFMIDSELTRDDRNYLDAIHFTVATSRRLAEIMVRLNTRREIRPEDRRIVDILAYPPPDEE